MKGDRGVLIREHTRPCELGEGNGKGEKDGLELCISDDRGLGR